MVHRTVLMHIFPRRYMGVDIPPAASSAAIPPPCPASALLLSLPRPPPIPPPTHTYPFRLDRPAAHMFSRFPVFFLGWSR